MATNSFYRTPHLTTISFAVGVLLFFLPFVAIKCNGTTVGELSGTALITGSGPKVGGDFKNMLEGLDQRKDALTKTSGKSDKDGKVYVVAIIALALGVLGVVASLLKKGLYNRVEMIIGILGAVALLVLLFQVKSDIDGQLKDKSKDTDEFSGMMKVSVDFTFWFYLCVLSYLSAAFFSYKQKDLALTQELPSALAPQVHIDNPGDQSNFPPAATGERDLG